MPLQKREKDLQRAGRQKNRSAVERPRSGILRRLPQPVERAFAIGQRRHYRLRGHSHGKAGLAQLAHRFQA